MFERRYVCFLAFKRLVNKNFNQNFNLDVSSNICENSLFNSPNFFLHETFFPKSISNIPGKEGVEAYSEPSWTSNMELFVEIVKGYLLLTIFAKLSILDVWLGCEYASGIFRPFMNKKVSRYTNADLILSLYVRVHIKAIPWKFQFSNFLPVKFAKYLFTNNQKQ